MRQARLLLGWIDDEPAAQMLNAQQIGVPLSNEQRNRLNQARASVAGRPARVEPANQIQPAPVELQGHIATLQQPGVAQAYWNEGWQVVLADLREIRAIQPHIYSDHSEERVAVIDPNDLSSVATVTLPLPTPTNLPAQFDSQRQAWMISAANLNLQITGSWGGPIQMGAQPGVVQTGPVVGFGFTVAITPSFLQVAKFRGQLILRDGYHRAYGLLRRGISIVPALYREFAPHAELGVGPMGLLSASAYLGNRPPLLTDYYDDNVSIEVTLPAPRKIIVIPGLQLIENT